MSPAPDQLLAGGNTLENGIDNVSHVGEIGPDATPPMRVLILRSFSMGDLHSSPVLIDARIPAPRNPMVPMDCEHHQGPPALAELRVPVLRSHVAPMGVEQHQGLPALVKFGVPVLREHVAPMDAGHHRAPPALVELRIPVLRNHVAPMDAEHLFHQPSSWL